MRILVTGAGGMLGRDLLSAARGAGHDVTGLTRAELDIADPGAVRERLAQARPEVVVNCAAWTNVDGAEENRDACRAVNVRGAGHVGAAAVDIGAWTIHVSSDYVFDGGARAPYLESATTRPLSNYGHAKLDGERALAAVAPGRHTIVRSSWLFGVHGACFPRTMLRLASERDEVRVVADQVGCPTWTGHLAPALLALAEDPDRPDGVLHVAAAGSCSWHAFAAAVIAAGPDAESTRVLPIATEQFPTPARRPAYGVMRSERGAPELPDWRAGLDGWLAGMAEAAGVGEARAGRS